MVQPRSCTDDPVANTEIEMVRSAINDLIDSTNDINFRAKFVRLAFHDCIGGCDGCVDMSDPENAGLEVPIHALAPIVAEFEHDCLSRADIWALAGSVGVDRGIQNPPDSSSINLFPFPWIGRQNCGADDPMNGPLVPMPHANMHIHDLLAYFNTEFGFDAPRVAALMGAHSLGRVEEDNSGFVGNGWDRDNEELVRSNSSQ